MSTTLKALVMADSKPIRAAFETQKIANLSLSFDISHTKFEQLVHVQQANTFETETLAHPVQLGFQPTGQ